MNRFYFFLSFALVSCSSHANPVDTKHHINTLPTLHSIDAFTLPVHIPSKQHILIHADSGQILSANHDTVKAPPASLTKLMTLLLTFERLQAKKLHLDMSVYISTQASQAKGATSTMLANTNFPLRKLLEAIAVASGNDASVALAEHLAGSEAAFATLMNAKAKTLGMTRTHFVNASGLPHPNHYSSARDIAILARHIYRYHPEYMYLFSTKTFSHKKFTQNNRNKLLWTNPDVFGMKTGHTESAGFCMAVIAKKNNHTLIAVTFGSDTEPKRFLSAQNLINLFENGFEHKIIHTQRPLPVVNVRDGTDYHTELSLAHSLTISAPTGSKLKSRITLKNHLQAPFAKNTEAGHFHIAFTNQTVASIPIVTSHAMEKGGFFQNSISWLRSKWK